MIRADFNYVEVDRELVVATHTDTIQAMLLVSCRFQDLDVSIKGRLGGDEEERIVTDPLFQAFTKRRVERDKALRSMQMIEAGSEQKTTLLAEESGDGQPFSCGFFRMNTLVEGVRTGRTNATQLMANFGGITSIEVGSDVADHSGLGEYAAALIFEVHARQLGEVPNSILVSRLAG